MCWLTKAWSRDIINVLIGRSRVHYLVVVAVVSFARDVSRPARESRDLWLTKQKNSYSSHLEGAATLAATSFLRNKAWEIKLVFGCTWACSQGSNRNFFLTFVTFTHTFVTFTRTFVTFTHTFVTFTHIFDNSRQKIKKSK